ncbi:hypothetical protein EPN96_10225 [bacterium]|nr:MAG: hypothetical protein EPN96_10225 [bacterium]
MNEMLAASRILENLRNLLGFKTKREAAGFFGVGPSAICDWVQRKGNKIPPSRLAEAARRHNIRWQWLAYGEGRPYEESLVETSTGVELGREEILLLQKLKESPAFKQAVKTLIGLDEREIKLLGAVADSMTRTGGVRENKKQESSGEEPWLEWRAEFPLTKLR